MANEKKGTRNRAQIAGSRGRVGVQRLLSPAICNLSPVLLGVLSLVTCNLSPALAQQPQAQGGQSIYAVNAKYGQGVGPGYLPWCDVKSQGAKGDGSTDDLPAFSACLALLSAVSSSIGGIVFVPPSTGPYRLSGPLHISKEITLLGAGAGDWGTTTGVTSRLMFDIGSMGIIVDAGGTSPSGTSGGTSVIRDLRIETPLYGGTLTSGSNQITSATSTAGISAGDPIIAMTNRPPPVSALPAGTTATAVTTTSVTLSNNAVVGGSAVFWKAGLLVGTGNVRSGSNLITNVTNTSVWATGDPMTAAGIPAIRTLKA